MLLDGFVAGKVLLDSKRWFPESQEVVLQVSKDCFLGFHVKGRCLLYRSFGMISNFCGGADFLIRKVDPV